MRVRMLDIETLWNSVFLNAEDAKTRGIDVESKIVIRNKERSVAAFTPILTTSLVNRGEIGIPKFLASQYGIAENDDLEVELVSTSESVTILNKKAKNERLSEVEIYKLIEDMVMGILDDAYISMFLTLQSTVGMSDEELYYLIKAMVETGNKINFDFPVYDEHSIGGVPGNSKVALIAVPTAVALGLRVPKTSSRAITSPSGTADTMEALANVNLSVEEIKKAVEKAGGIIAWTGQLNLSPADDIMVRVERRLMLDPPSQVVASILSKKVALGINGLVVDLPVGHGTKLESVKEAEDLAVKFIVQGNKFGMRVKGLITFGGEPIGYSIGPNLEAIEALSVMMNRQGAQSLVDKALNIAGTLYELAGKASPGEGAYIAKEAFAQGKSLEVFKRIIEAQGGNPSIKPEDIPTGDYKETIYSNKNGAVTFIDNKALSLIARLAGAPLDKKAGIKLYAKIGHRVKQGDPLYTIYSSTSTRLREAVAFASSVNEIEIGTMLLKTVP